MLLQMAKDSFIHLTYIIEHLLYAILAALNTAVNKIDPCTFGVYVLVDRDRKYKHKNKHIDVIR